LNIAHFSYLSHLALLNGVTLFEFLETFKNLDTGVIRAADNEDFVIPGCDFLTQYSSVTS